MLLRLLGSRTLLAAINHQRDQSFDDFPIGGLIPSEGRQTLEKTLPNLAKTEVTDPHNDHASVGVPELRPSIRNLKMGFGGPKETKNVSLGGLHGGHQLVPTSPCVL